MPELKNAQHERFAQAYCLDLNKTKAARIAGYSEHSAGQRGFEVFERPDVAARISELMEQRAEDCKVDAQYVLSKLKVISEAKIEDYVRMIEVETGTGKRKKTETKLVWKNFDSLTPDQRGAIKEMKQGKFGVEIKLFDKSWSLDMIAKHIGLYEVDNKQKVQDAVQIYIPDNGRQANEIH